MAPVGRWTVPWRLCWRCDGEDCSGCLGKEELVALETIGLVDEVDLTGCGGEGLNLTSGRYGILC